MTRDDHQTVNNELSTQPRRIGESGAELEEAEIVAVSAAAITFGLSLLINLVCFLITGGGTDREDLTNRMLSWTFSGLILCGMLIAPVSFLSGWLAHSLFHRTNIRVATASMAFSAIAMLTIFGWFYVAILSVIFR